VKRLKTTSKQTTYLKLTRLKYPVLASPYPAPVLDRRRDWGLYRGRFHTLSQASLAIPALQPAVLLLSGLIAAEAREEDENGGINPHKKRVTSA
jgi:hypothetical protein